MSEQEKLDWVSFAIQEAINGNVDELEQALEFVEELRDACTKHIYDDER